MTIDTRFLLGRWWPIVAGGLIAGVVTIAVGTTVEIWRFGRSDRAALERLHVHVDDAVTKTAGLLQATGDVLAGVVAPAVGGDEAAQRSLFDAVGSAARDGHSPELAVTVYSPTGSALAWSGRPSELPLARITGNRSLFVAPGPAALRLVYVRPITVETPGGSRRLGSVAVEQVLSEAQGVRRPAEEQFLLPTPVVPVSLRQVPSDATPSSSAEIFFVEGPSGEPLVEARVTPEHIALARTAHRQQVLGVLLIVFALTMLLLIGVALDDGAAPAADWRQYLRAITFIALLLAAARLALEAGLARFTASRVESDPGFDGLPQEWPIGLFLDGLILMALAALAADALGRWRRTRRGRRPGPSDGTGQLVWFVTVQALAGLAAALLLLGHLSLLRATIAAGGFDVLQLSLHPLDAERLLFGLGLLFWQVAIVWGLLLLFRAALAPWRFVPRVSTLTISAWIFWVGPAVAVAAVSREPSDLPIGATLLVTIAAATAASVARRVVAWYRHAPQASRLLALAAALVVPPMVLYPMVIHVGDGGKRNLVENEYGPEATNHAQTLQVQLAQALGQIDTLPGLDVRVASLREIADAAAGGVPDPAFRVWRQTDLAIYRVPSAVEIYGAGGRLASRFALNFPEYGVPEPRWQGDRCEWEIFGEVLPLGAQERRTLHAERAICVASDGGAVPVGGIVVHVMLDYRILPFLSSQSPYFELFRVAPRSAKEARAYGQDIELAIYGWGLHPIFMSGTGAWSIDDRSFARLYASREPFWTTLTKGGLLYHVYFTNNRFGIYAIGYPALGLFDHLVSLAQIGIIAGAVFVVLLAAAMLFTRVARRRPLTGRAILREIRASFYRRLLLAFIGAAALPAILLAFVIRTYFVAELRSDVEAGATRTSAVAQRFIEEMAALVPRDGSAMLANDDVLVWISQAIDEEVNIFEGATLVATSERDLFASGLISTRTPDNVYRAIVLERLPSYMAVDRIGNFEYLLAAAPLGTGGRDAILTVPLLPRQQEIEREIDEIDRGIELGALLFVLLGAGIGHSMAERIADPVRRLTRAAQRIARGDFDARVAARSADELQRLVEAFNRMAGELEAQRAELERTYRLEAWAEMARQVAHEIKNPLTPIQLSAEHLVRVHADRGRPLAPALEQCVESILSQVTLLRRIAAEFSSFAAAPQARLAPTSMAELVNEVIRPYQVGLGDRVMVEVDVPVSLPRVLLDRYLVAQALTNIIENALHAMPGRGTLSIAGTEDDGWVRLRMADSGVGMDTEALARVFEPYFSTKSGGTGLGLVIAKRNVGLSGGRIDVRSEKGAGTEVVLTFPSGDQAGR